MGLLARVLDEANARRAERRSGSASRDRFHVLAGDACNNRCLFCMEGETARLHGVTPERVRELLRAHASEREVMFTSGEPTLNPHLVPYLRWARECGYRRIGLTTNARRLGYRPYARQLLEAGLNHVVVSIHGPDARSHDAQTRTPGSFVQTLAGLEALSELRRDHALTVHTSTVVGRRNVGRIAELYWLLRPFAVDQCVFNVMQPLGRAQPLVRSLVAPYPEVVREFARLAREVGSGKPAVFLVDVPPCATQPLPPPVRGWVETAAFTEYGRAGDPLERQTRVEKEQANREKRTECSRCVHDATCLGVWRGYLEAYGWEGLEPVPRPPERASG
jgi:MoaA/NifB/PqqE/SkfB family radical SAM enzyme